MTPTPNKTHPERTKRLHKSHYEDIICQGCQEVERAEVVHTRPWFSYVHECSKCGFINMESEWQEAHILHLVLTHEWYDEHAAGRKDIEYRAISKHWCRLIWDRRDKLTHVRYSRGYSSITMIRKIERIDLGACEHEGWEGTYYRIHHQAPAIREPAKEQQ